MLISGGNSTIKVAPVPRGNARTPQLLDGVASNKRLPFRLGVALASIQKYAAGAVPSYINPVTSMTLSERIVTVPWSWCCLDRNDPKEIGALSTLSNRRKRIKSRVLSEWHIALDIIVFIVIECSNFL